MNIVVVLMLLLMGLWTTSMASKGPRGHRGQEWRTSSCRNLRMFNRRLQVCLKDARTNIRMLEEEKNESMETRMELEIKNQNLVEEKQTCMINNDILEDEIKGLKEQTEYDSCLSVSCGNFGTCFSNGASYICNCLAGWSGPSCNVSTLDCDFDRSLCTWGQGIADDFDWSWNTGNTPTANTGPNADHTTGTGYYMYIEATGLDEGDRADLVSTLLAPGHTYCMEIAFNMYGDGNDIGHINVYVKPEGMTEVEIQQYFSDGVSQDWFISNVTIPSQTDNFRVVIAGIRGEDDQSDVAIDDILLMPGAC